MGSIARALVLLVLGGLGGWFAHSIHASIDPKPTVYIFDDKRFTDSGSFVYAAGSRTGQGVSYPDNTWAVGCYQDKNECWTAWVEGISKDSCQIGRME